MLSEVEMNLIRALAKVELPEEDAMMVMMAAEHYKVEEALTQKLETMENVQELTADQIIEMIKKYDYFYTEETVTTFKWLAINSRNKVFLIKTINTDTSLPKEANLISNDVFDLLLIGMKQANYKKIK